MIMRFLGSSIFGVVALSVLSVAPGYASPVFVTASCPANVGQVGTSYSSALVGNNGLAPYSFSLTGGALPGGLSLASDGTISGTPSAYGAFNFSAQVVAANGGTGTTPVGGCTITILPPTLALACGANTATAGTAYSSSLVASGGVSPYAYSVAGTLPAGLTLGANGLISGIPSNSGTFAFTATVVDSSGLAVTGTVSQSCSITVAAVSNVCGLSPGYWKNHNTWPLTSLTLGGQTYNQAELENLLSLPKKGDDSIILAFQLIAARLNVADGTNAATAGNNIAKADQLLSGYSKPLPYGVSNAAMNTVATNLNAFNNDGQLQPGCTMPQ